MNNLIELISRLCQCQGVESFLRLATNIEQANGDQFKFEMKL